MAEYIERTETVVLAMNAGARAIENTKRYRGTVYTKDVFSDHPQEIPYLQAAKVLREVSGAPTVDAVEVVCCRDCKHSWQDLDGLCCSHGVCVDCTVPEDFYCSYGERKQNQ